MARLSESDQRKTNNTIGIMAFETARAMSGLVSLYNSLTDEGIIKFKQDVIKSQGVSYLNSKDESFLLSLALAERLQDLDRVAVTASRLARNCNNDFDKVYADTKLGLIDGEKLEFGSKRNGKIIQIMEKLITGTSNLYVVLQSLAELEEQEGKIEQWKKSRSPDQWKDVNFQVFNHNIEFQRKQVRFYNESSLWNQTFDKSIGLVTRMVCIIYARICSVFGPQASSSLHFSKPKVSPRKQKHQQVRVHPATDYCLLEDRDKYRSKTSNKLILPEDTIINKCGSYGVKGNGKSVYEAAPHSTVGGSGLTLRYVNVIILTDKYFNEPAKIGKDERNALYEMLPERLKVMLKSKLKSHWLKMDGEEPVGGDGGALAEGWREAVERIMGWLAPMAYDTMMWMSERNLERQKVNLKAKTLLLQTLHYSDLEKTEASIVEVLVGLSCICKYDDRLLN